MQSSTDFERLLKIFYPDDAEQLSKIESENIRFAYYTSADVAKQIIDKKEIWLRNATVMNDFLEITYGLDLTKKAFGSAPWKDIMSAANSVLPGIQEKVMAHFNYWDRYLPTETYLTCLSLHDDKEDEHGRLSMWRAYGDVALIINNTPLTNSSEELGVFSTPVHYLDQAGFEERLQKVAQAVTNNIVYLHALDEKVTFDFICSMLLVGVIGTKHPGFAEEKEWRIFFQPEDYPDNILTKEIVTIQGVVQEIWKLPLKHDPDNGLHHADIPSLINRIIIGPTQHSEVSKHAFVNLLDKAGVEDAANKVFVSEIPLRMRT